MLCNTSNISAQVTIGTGKQAASGALLQLKQDDNLGANSTKGLLLPRVNLVDLETIIGVISGVDAANSESHSALTVYNLVTNQYVCPGVYTWVGNHWMRLQRACDKLISDIIIEPNGIIKLIVGDNQVLTVKELPGNQITNLVNWTSSEPQYATVDANGKVIAINVGASTVTATSTVNVGKSATKTVEVENITLVLTADANGVDPMQMITSSNPDKKDKLTITAAVGPQWFADKFPARIGVDWITSKPAIASVAADGTVSADTAGDATITATTKTNAISKTVDVRVHEIGLSATSTSPINVLLGEEATIGLTVAPSFLTSSDIRGNVTWSGNPAGMTIANDKVKSTAETADAGVTILATSDKDPSKTLARTVVVNDLAVTVNPTTQNLLVGETATITSTVTPTWLSAADKKVNWTPVTSTVAQVDANGLVTVKGVGAQTVTATSQKKNGKTATAAVNVKQLGVNIIPTDAKLLVGETLSLTSAVTPTDAGWLSEIDKETNWATLQPAIVGLNSSTVNGAVVQGVAVGSGNITATSKRAGTATGKVATKNVSVEQLKVTLSPATAQKVIVGDKINYTATTVPSWVTDAVIWGSNDTTKVSIDPSSGIAIGVAVGSTTIKGTSQQTGTATGKVATSGQIDVENVTLVVTPNANGVKPLEMITSSVVVQRDKLKVASTVGPQWFADKFPSRLGVDWASNTPTIAGVDAAGEISAVAVGDATITATTQTNAIQKTVPVKVHEIGLSATSASSMNLLVGEEGTIGLNVTPAFLAASDARRNVTWSGASTGMTIANDKVKSTQETPDAGVVIIAKSDKDPSKTLSRTVVVKDVKVAVNPTTAKLLVGETLSIISTVTPTWLSAADKKVIWTPATATIAQVDANGLVTAKAVGSQTITATSQKKSASTVTTTVDMKQLAVNITPLESRMLVGETVGLSAAVAPTDAGWLSATDKEVLWTPATATVAQVSAAGVVTAKAVGSQTITATSKRAGTATGKVANKAMTVEQLKVTLTPAVAQQVIVGDEVAYSAVASPTWVGNAVTWSPTNAAVASVSATGVAKGNTTIKATSNRVGTATGKLATSANIEVDQMGITMPTARLEMVQGQTLVLNGANVAVPTPGWAPAAYRNVQWSLELVDHAINSSVTGSGTNNNTATIVAGEKGEAILTAKTTATKTSYQASISRNVTIQSMDIRLTPYRVTLYLDGKPGYAKYPTSAVINATHMPDASEYRAKNWTVPTGPTFVTMTPSADNESVTVVAKTQGSSVVKATGLGNATGTATVNVLTCPTSINDAGTPGGGTYSVRRFGDQCWMTNNLSTQTHTNEPNMQPATTRLGWAILPAAATWAFPRSYIQGLGSVDPAQPPTDWNKEKYGLLYSYAAATNSGKANGIKLSNESYDTYYQRQQGICPTGWHLPSIKEWKYLREKVKEEYDQISSYVGTAAGNEGNIMSAKSQYQPQWGKSNSAKHATPWQRGFDAQMTGGISIFVGPLTGS